jgi:hypothetical protein
MAYAIAHRRSLPSGLDVRPIQMRFMSTPNYDRPRPLLSDKPWPSHKDQTQPLWAPNSPHNKFFIPQGMGLGFSE